jgi:hypothetical protein
MLQMLETKPTKNNLLKSSELNQRMNKTLMLSSRQMGWNGILVEQYQLNLTPSEIDIPARSNHFLNLHFGQPVQLTQKHDSCLYESTVHKGKSSFIPAGQPSFTEVSDRCFALTPLAVTLKSDSPGSMRYAALAQMEEEHSLGWSNGLHSLKTGEIAFDTAAGMPVWDYYDRHPEAGQIFSRSMTDLGNQASQAVATTYDFSKFNTIVDVGGAQGNLISEIVRSYPHLTGILFDLSEVIANVSLDDNIQPIAGNFFESVPSGGDAYLMRWIVHDWDDEKSLMILKNCHQAMQDRGKLLLIESIIPPDNVPSPAKFIDLIMLMMTGGQERTEAEYRSLLQLSGFELARVIPTASMFSIIEAVKL